MPIRGKVVSRGYRPDDLEQGRGGWGRGWSDGAIPNYSPTFFWHCQEIFTSQEATARRVITVYYIHIAGFSVLQCKRLGTFSRK